MPETIRVRTWGRWGRHDPLGVIRVRVEEGDVDTAHAAARTIGQRLGLEVCAGPRYEGTALDERGRPAADHWAVMLGRRSGAAGFVPEAEVRFAVPRGVRRERERVREEETAAAT
jgi:hypothetical protein